MRIALRILGLLAGIAIALSAMATVDAASITVSPGSVAPGGPVTVSGDVLAGGSPGCQVPGAVLLFSDAFGGTATPVQATAAADATFSVQVTVPAGVAPGSYAITGRCGGGNLGVQATLVVTPGLPATGSGGLLDSGRTGHPAGAPATIILLAIGALALLASGVLVRRSA
jgi:hypothetical protein